MTKNLTSKIVLSLLIGGLFSCSNSSDTNTANSAELYEAPLPPNQALPTNCKQPSPVADIWKLEPILLKKGKIQENMTQAEKEKVIRGYIETKNKQYQQCIKGKKL